MKTMRIVFVGISLVLFLIAYNFGNQRPCEQVSGGYVGSGNAPIAGNVGIVSNYVSGLAALGFAISGGLALVAAAIVKPDK
jgi:hypothetical protein